MKVEEYAKTNDGRTVYLYTLENDKGTNAKIITFGGIITELWVPDRVGVLGDIVLGFDEFKQYENENPYFGCVTGRVANRIAGGRFNLDGISYNLDVNDGPNHLHGGIKGYDKVIWDAQAVGCSDCESVRLMYESPDGEEGYPGNLSISVTYILNADNSLRIEYEARTDRSTPINLTNHSYFNLSSSGDILDHILTLKAGYYTETEDNIIPTGRLLPVVGTPLDFILPSSVGKRIGELKMGGYDHNFVLDNGGEKDVGLAAELYDPYSGRVLTLYTTEPGVQVYSGIHLDGLKGKRGATYDRYHGICLETQHFPDSINQKGFPSVILRPNEIFRSITTYAFSAR